MLVVPLAPSDTVEALRGKADVIVALEQPHWFSAGGGFCDEFEPVADDDVLDLLRAARARRPESPAWTGTELAA